MIRANELRVGNYFTRKDIPGNWYKIRSISKDRLHPINTVEQDFKKNAYYASDCELCDLLPIEISGDLLARFGFAPELAGIEYSIALPIGNGLDLFIEEDFSCGLRNTLENVSLYLKDIQYLHQLQNLYFALTNQELKIKL